MASKRLMASTVNWAEFASKVPEAQRASFNALKNKTDGYVRRIGALPDKLPEIDWTSYKARVQVQGQFNLKGLSTLIKQKRPTSLCLLPKI